MQFGDQIIQHVLEDEIPASRRERRKTSLTHRRKSSIDSNFVQHQAEAQIDVKDPQGITNEVDHRENA